jgi:hypothetical protein
MRSARRTSSTISCCRASLRRSEPFPCQREAQACVRRCRDACPARLLCSMLATKDGLATICHRSSILSAAETAAWGQAISLHRVNCKQPPACRAIQHKMGCSGPIATSQWCSTVCTKVRKRPRAASLRSRRPRALGVVPRPVGNKCLSLPSQLNGHGQRDNGLLLVCEEGHSGQAPVLQHLDDEVPWEKVLGPSP